MSCVVFPGNMLVPNDNYVNQMITTLSLKTGWCQFLTRCWRNRTPR